jgi:hypothetical protein
VKHTDDLVSFDAIAEAADVSVQTIRRRVREDNLEVFTNADRRRRFLRREDAEWLLRPRPASRSAGASGADAIVQVSGAA